MIESTNKTGACLVCDSAITTSCPEGRAKPGKAVEEDPPPKGQGNADGEGGEDSEQEGKEGKEGRDQKSGRFISQSTQSAEMNVTELNSFRDPDLVNSLSLLEASADAAALKFCVPETEPDAGSLASVAVAMLRSQMHQIFVRVLERKMEVLQWQLFELVSNRENLVQISLVGAKKDQVRVSVPVEPDLCMPFAGAISVLESTSSGPGLSKSYPFGTLFGLHFHVQPKSLDTQNGDFVIPAWAAKSVTKASESFFQQKKYTAPMVAVRPSSEASPMDISLHLVTDQFGIDNMSNLEEQAASAEFLGGGACCLAFTEGFCLSIRFCLCLFDESKKHIFGACRACQNSITLDESVFNICSGFGSHLCP